MAAVFALLNDFRLSRGDTPLGWINPWLYGRGSQGFQDITLGNNPGCNTDEFRATTGWDPVRPARPLSLHFRLC
jgi:tripeptidyl-peptidase-1